MSPEDDLYALADCQSINLQNGGNLLIHRHNDCQMIVSPEVATALFTCHSFASLSGHAERLTATIPQLQGQQADVLKVLNAVRDNGLMTSAGDTCTRLCPADTPPATDLPATRAFIITCDRPAAVRRLLESMLRAGNLTQHEHLFLIDDSRDPDNATLNREAVAQFNFTSARDMCYVGAEAQQRLLDGLVRALPKQEQGIRFLVDRKRWSDKKSYGLARNLCLLLSIGCRAVVMDDDVICTAVASPHRREGLSFGDTRREVDFYASQDDILQRTTRADFDPLSGHARFLGLNLAQAINRLGYDRLSPAQLQSANAACIDLWCAESPILVTQSGSLGDPGTPGTQWLYTLDGASAQRVLDLPGGLEAALSSRQYWVGQPRPTFGRRAHMSQITGLDNSRLLPPYFPVFRSEDDLFGAMLSFLHPDSVVLDQDWAIPHFPLEARGAAAPQTQPDGRVETRFGRLIDEQTHYQEGITPETRLTRLAALVRELAETPDRGLITLYRSETASRQAREAQKIRTLLQQAIPRTESWRTYLEQRLGGLNTALQAVPDLCQSGGVPQSYTGDAVLADFRGYAGGFAAALNAWSDLRGAASKVSDELLATGQLSPL
jgi:hypothetical protein